MSTDSKSENNNNLEIIEKLNKIPGIKFLLLKNLNSLLTIILEEISDFKQNNQSKIKSISVLCYIISQCGLKISPDFFSQNQGILSNMFKYLDTDEEISKKCEECSVAIGIYTDQNILIPLIINSIKDMEITTSFQPLFVRIKFLANYLSKLPQIEEQNCKLILETLNNLDLFNIDDPHFSKNILLYTFKIYASIILSLKENCKNFHEEIFFHLLILSSLPECSDIKTQVLGHIQILAENCNLKIEDLYSLEIGNVLEKFKKTYKNWKKNSPDRFAFDIYVKLAGTSLEKHWTEVLLIISQCCEAEKDIEMRMDMIILLDKIILNKTLHEQIKNYIEFILPEILFPACVWRVGRPNYKVRKAAMQQW